MKHLSNLYRGSNATIPIKLTPTSFQLCLIDNSILDQSNIIFLDLLDEVREPDHITKCGGKIRVPNKFNTKVKPIIFNE